MLERIKLRKKVASKRNSIRNKRLLIVNINGGEQLSSLKARVSELF